MKSMGTTDAPLPGGFEVRGGKTLLLCRHCGRSVKWVDGVVDFNVSHKENPLPKIPEGWRHVIKSNIVRTNDEYSVCGICYDADRDYSTR